MIYKDFKAVISRMISPENSQFVIDFWEEWSMSDHPKTFDELKTEIACRSYAIDNILDIMARDHKDYKVLEAILTILRNMTVYEFDIK